MQVRVKRREWEWDINTLLGSSQRMNGVILDLLEDPEQTDDEVVAVHDQAYSDKADQRQLSVANCLPIQGV